MTGNSKYVIGSLVLSILIFANGGALAQQSGSDLRSQFVLSAGSSLQISGKPFRYSGPNIEWLGLEAYGPHDPQGPRYPTHFEVDDALDAAREMGARVVRAGAWETICDKCATDADAPWPDPKPAGLFGIKYRVIAYNADGTPSAPSPARYASPIFVMQHGKRT